MTKTYVPGQIVTIAGIEFVILDDFGELKDGSRRLFILTLKSQGKSNFGDTNNYAKSKLRDAVGDWRDRLLEKIDREYVLPRTIDLTTMDGHGKYGVLTTDAAPLTMDEARKYADIIPNCEDACWLATGWGGPEYFGSMAALYVGNNGNWCYNLCSFSFCIRPALVISSLLLASEDEPDLSEYSTDELLAEVRRRMGDYNG